jgi:FkbH-like protein
MMEDIWPTYPDILKNSRKLPELSADKSTSSHIRIMVGGNCNTDFLEPALQVTFAEDHTNAVIVRCGYDSWISHALSADDRIDAWVIWISTMGLSNGGILRANLDITGIIVALQAILDRGERVIAIIPETLDISIDGFSAFSRWNRTLRQNFLAALPEEILIIDPDVLLLDAPHGMRNNPTYWSLAKLPLHPNAAVALGIEAARIISRSRRQKIKVIAVDLDNTLWGGVVGELGAEGVHLDPNGNGRPYLQLQRLLKDISDEGIPLAVVSKNNPEDARAPFRTRDEMLLNEGDFVKFVANWDNKFKAIEAIASDLNIGLDAICFLDDSQHEREEAQNFLPELIVPELHENPEMRPQMLVRSRLFLHPVVSAEDTKRVDYYKEEASRHKLSEKIGNWEDYLRSLDMKLVARPVSATNLQRVTSLVQKTNQFNLTTRRRELSEIKALSEAPSWFTYCYSLEDKFGDSGVIGVIFAKITASELDLDSFILSCRVMGRRVEFGMASHLLQWFNDHDLESIAGTYARTPKNLPSEGFLKDLGFEVTCETAEETQYRGERLFPPIHFTHLEI